MAEKYAKSNVGWHVITRDTIQCETELVSFFRINDAALQLAAWDNVRLILCIFSLDFYATQTYFPVLAFHDFLLWILN